MRTFLAAMLLALVAGPALAQIGGINMLPGDKNKTPRKSSAVKQSTMLTMKR
jgi:hypothetical protein